VGRFGGKAADLRREAKPSAALLTISIGFLNVAGAFSHAVKLKG